MEKKLTKIIMDCRCKYVHVRRDFVRRSLFEERKKDEKVWPDLNLLLESRDPPRDWYACRVGAQQLAAPPDCTSPAVWTCLCGHRNGIAIIDTTATL
jgi:hypothetical protein